MELPLTDAVVEQELVGKPLSLVSNVMGSPVHNSVTSFTLRGGGGTDEGYLWDTDDGALRISDASGACIYEFRGMETKNGVVYFVGRHLHSSSPRRWERMMLHIAVPCGSRKWAVCISSHASYREHTLEPLLKSIRKSGLKQERVYVSVGASAQEKFYEDGGVRYREIKENYRGFTALSVAAREEEEVDYWLPLHDTCAVQPDFERKIAALDVGLNPDVVLFRHPTDFMDMGLYRSDYLAAVVPDLPSMGPSALSKVVDNSRIAVILNCNLRDGGEKDVYGMGVHRQVLEMPMVGIQKFRGKAVDGGKP